VTAQHNAPAQETMTSTLNTVWNACSEITGTNAPLDMHANLFDIGLDSLGLAELVIQLEEVFGEGSITIDDIMGNPIVSVIAAHLSGGKDDVKPVPMPPRSAAVAPDATTKAVWAACCQIIGKDEDTAVDAHLPLSDMGIDSLGLAELVIQLEELYGEGAITIDDIMASANVSQIAAKLGGGTPANVPSTKPNYAAPPPPKPTPIAAVVPPKPMRPQSTPPSVKLTTPAPVGYPTLASTPLAAPQMAAGSPIDARLDQLESVLSQLTEVVKTLTPKAGVKPIDLSADAIGGLVVPETPSLGDVLSADPVAEHDSCTHHDAVLERATEAAKA